VLFFRHVVFRDWYWRLFQPWWGQLHRGPHLLVGHVLVWSLPMALVSWLVIRILAQSWRLQPLSLTRHWPHARSPSPPRSPPACTFTGTPTAGPCSATSSPTSTRSSSTAASSSPPPG